MKQIQDLHLQDAKKILSGLKSYSEVTKKLWLRWRGIFTKFLTGSKSFEVEYFPALWEESAWSQSLVVFKKSFNLTPDKSEVVFTPLENIKWWMKVYVDDNMVDLSFDKVEKMMQK